MGTIFLVLLPVSIPQENGLIAMSNSQIHNMHTKLTSLTQDMHQISKALQQALCHEPKFLRNI